MDMLSNCVHDIVCHISNYEIFRRGENLRLCSKDKFNTDKRKIGISAYNTIFKQFSLMSAVNNGNDILLYRYSCSQKQRM